MKLHTETGHDDPMIRTRIVHALLCFVGLVFVLGSIFGPSVFDIEDAASGVSSLIAEYDAGVDTSEDGSSPFFTSDPVGHFCASVREHSLRSTTPSDFTASTDILHYAPKQSPPATVG